MSYSIYFINMPKDIGRKLWISEIHRKMSTIYNSQCIIWNGIDASIYDEHNILIKSCDSQTATLSAKQAKIQLLEHFMKTSENPFMILFEDDIMVHQNFYSYFDQVINFTRTNSFKLIYFGVSNGLISESSKKLLIKPLPKKNFRYTGAYGVIIDRSIIPKLIIRSQDPSLITKPFDIYSLGHIQDCYPQLCFICHPQIVVPNITTSNIRDPRNQSHFWNISHLNSIDYIFPIQVPMFILIEDHKLVINKYLKLLQMFVPYVKPIFISYEKINIIESLYETIIVPSFEKDIINQRIIEYRTSNKLLQNKYILTNIYVHWTCKIDNIFDNSLSISYDINPCIKCHELQLINLSTNILNGFHIIIPEIPSIHTNNKNIYGIHLCYHEFGIILSSQQEKIL